jgi:hypothetical protein
MYGKWRYSSRTLSLGTRWEWPASCPCCSIPGETPPGTHCIGGWVAPWSCIVQLGNHLQSAQMLLLYFCWNEQCQIARRLCPLFVWVVGTDYSIPCDCSLISPQCIEQSQVHLQYSIENIKRTGGEHYCLLGISYTLYMKRLQLLLMWSMPNCTLREA